MGQKNIVEFIEKGGFNHSLLKNLFFLDLSILVIIWLLKTKKVQRKLEEYYKIIKNDLNITYFIFS